MKHNTWKKVLAFTFAMTLSLSAAIPAGFSAPGALTAQAAESTASISDAAYDEILNDFRGHLANGFGEDEPVVYGALLEQQNGYSPLWRLMGNDFNAEMVGYAIQDLDGDGVKELVLGTIDKENDEYTIVEIYTAADKVYHIASASERDGFSVTNRNMICEEGSSSATDSVTMFYTVDGNVLKPDSGYRTDANGWYAGENFVRGEGGYTADWKYITEAEYNEALNFHRTERILLTSFADAEPQSASQTSEQVYAPIIKDVASRLEKGFGSMPDDILYGVLLNVPGNNLDAFSYLWYMDPNAKPSNMGYAIADLDGNSIDELVIGAMDEDGNAMIYDLYTQYEGNVYHIAAAGERDSFALTNRGTIVEEGSGGADSSLVMFYQIGRNVLEPDTGYKTENGRTYKMKTYMGNEDTGVGYDFTWEETSEETDNYAYQNIKLTSFAAASENPDQERFLVKTDTEGMGLVAGAQDGDEPAFVEDATDQKYIANVFAGTTITLKTRALDGWKFKEWKDNATGKTYSTEDTLTITVTAPLDLIAVFEFVSDEPEHIASDEELLNWVKIDYEKKTGVAVTAEITAENGTEYTIAVMDQTGKVLNTYTIDAATGIGTNAAGAEINLPQTGVTSWDTALAVGGAMTMAAAGAWLAFRAARRKEQ